MFKQNIQIATDRKCQSTLLSHFHLTIDDETPTSFHERTDHGQFLFSACLSTKLALFPSYYIGLSDNYPVRNKTYHESLLLTSTSVIRSSTSLLVLKCAHSTTCCRQSSPVFRRRSYK